MVGLSWVSSKEEYYLNWLALIAMATFGFFSVLICAKPPKKESPRTSNLAGSPEPKPAEKGNENAAETTKTKESMIWDFKQKTKEEVATDLDSIKDEENPLQNSKVRDKLLKRPDGKGKKNDELKAFSRPGSRDTSVAPKALASPGKVDREKLLQDKIFSKADKRMKDEKRPDSVKSTQVEDSKRLEFVDDSVSTKKTEATTYTKNTTAAPLDSSVSLAVNPGVPANEKSGRIGKKGFFNRMFSRGIDYSSEPQDGPGSSVRCTSTPEPKRKDASYMAKPKVVSTDKVVDSLILTSAEKTVPVKTGGVPIRKLGSTQPPNIDRRPVT